MKVASARFCGCARTLGWRRRLVPGCSREAYSRARSVQAHAGSPSVAAGGCSAGQIAKFLILDIWHLSSNLCLGWESLKDSGNIPLYTLKLCIHFLFLVLLVLFLFFLVILSSIALVTNAKQSAHTAKDCHHGKAGEHIPWHAVLDLGTTFIC